MYRQNAGTCHRLECGRLYETRLRPGLRQSPTVKRLPRIRHETKARGRRTQSRNCRTESTYQIHNRGRMKKQPQYLVEAIYTPRSKDGFTSVTVQTATCLQKLNELLKEFTNITSDTRLTLTIHKLSKHDIKNNTWSVTK